MIGASIELLAWTFSVILMAAAVIGIAVALPLGWRLVRAVERLAERAGAVEVGSESRPPAAPLGEGKRSLESLGRRLDEVAERQAFLESMLERRTEQPLPRS